MRIAHHPVCEFMPFRAELARELHLLPDERDFPRKVQVNVRRSAIRTEQGNGVNAVVPAALVAYQLAEKIVSSEPRCGFGRRPCASRHLEKFVASVLPGEVIEHAVDCRRGVGVKGMSDDFLGSREVVWMRKVLVVVQYAAIRTDCAWRTGRVRHARRQRLG